MQQENKYSCSYNNQLVPQNARFFVTWNNNRHWKFNFISAHAFTYIFPYRNFVGVLADDRLGISFPCGYI